MGKKSAATAAVDAILAKAGGKKKKQGKKNRKIGRYAKSPACMRYKGERRWLSNRLKRMARHIKRFPGDTQAVRLLAEFKAA